MKSNEITSLIVVGVIFLLLGAFSGHYLFPKEVEKIVFKDKIVEVEKECPIQEACPICEECKDVKCPSCKTEIKQICNPDTPNEQLTKEYVTDPEQLKHTQTRTLSVTCESFKVREEKAGRLNGTCWLGKRTMVHYEPERNGNQCTIISTSGC
jgi:hypothetical protein